MHRKKQLIPAAQATVSMPASVPAALALPYPLAYPPGQPGLKSGQPKTVSVFQTARDRIVAGNVEYTNPLDKIGVGNMNAYIYRASEQALRNRMS